MHGAQGMHTSEAGSESRPLLSRELKCSLQLDVRFYVHCVWLGHLSPSERGEGQA